MPYHGTVIHFRDCCWMLFLSLIYARRYIGLNCFSTVYIFASEKCNVPRCDSIPGLIAS